MADSPKVIFKYVGPDRIDIIQNLRIRFTQSSTTIDKGGEKIHLFQIPPGCIKRVVLGCCMDSSKRRELLQFIRTNPALRDVRAEEAKRDPEKFELNYSPA